MHRQEKPPLRTKLLYSTGDLSVSILLAILMFFQLYFLTDVAHLRPDLAGWAVGIGKMWDAVLRSDQVTLAYVLAALSGSGIATAYVVIPWARVPDVVEHDQLGGDRLVSFL